VCNCPCNNGTTAWIGKSEAPRPDVSFTSKGMFIIESLPIPAGASVIVLGPGIIGAPLGAPGFVAIGVSADALFDDPNSPSHAVLDVASTTSKQKRIITLGG